MSNSDNVYCSNEDCDYGTENDQQGNWAFICPDCGQENIVEDDSISWGELAELTHETQVARFGFCTCEDNEGNENPYADCP